MPEPAILALADGTCFVGESIGAAGSAVGEVVFNTAMTGYQEIATDPSYCRQIVTLTVPHIGNTGCTAEDEESTALHLAGLVIRDLPVRVSNWRSQGDLPDYLGRHGVVGIAGIDTRALTAHLRSTGAQPGCLLAGPQAAAGDAREQAVAAAREFPGLSGMDLARVVSSREGYTWSAPPWQLDGTATTPEPRFRVVAYDFGVKHNILRELVALGCAVQVVPATTPAADVLAQRPDGVFLSNGPGDPEPCDYAIEAIRQLLDAGVPLFGICLGHQLLGLAAGARTQKMKFGHHGANHPVLDIASGQVLITSQNHGFAVDEASLPDGVRATHRSLFDGTLQGLELSDRPAFGFQGHPEASPGPHDMKPLFHRFAALMRERA